MRKSNQIILQKLQFGNQRYSKQRSYSISNSKSKQDCILKIYNNPVSTQKQKCAQIKQNQNVIYKHNKYFLKQIKNKAISSPLQNSYTFKHQIQHKRQLVKVKNQKYYTSQQEIQNNQKYKCQILKQKEISQKNINHKEKQSLIKNIGTSNKQIVTEKIIKNTKQSFLSLTKLLQHNYLNPTTVSSKINFNKPEQIAQRLIFYKKSVFTNGNRNYLIQISVAYKKLFILVFDLNGDNTIQRLIFDQKQSNQILIQHNYNFNQIAQKISIYPHSIILNKQEKLIELLQNNRNKETNLKKYKRQRQFEKRNVYNKKMEKFQKHNKNTQINQKLIKKVITDIDNTPKTINIQSRFRSSFIDRLNIANQQLNKYQQNISNKINQKQQNNHIKFYQFEEQKENNEFQQYYQQQFQNQEGKFNDNEPYIQKNINNQFIYQNIQTNKQITFEKQLNQLYQ